MGCQQLCLVAIDDGRPVGNSWTNGRNHGTGISRKIGIIFRNLWSRTDQTHFPAQHVDKLRQLVNLRLAQEMAEAGYTSVTSYGYVRTWRSITHGPELQNVKGSSMPTNALLPEKHGPVTLQGDANGSKDEKRKCADQQSRTNDQIEKALHHAATPWSIP